jgi:formylglycine-generating enzyme required for sulfatase activity/ABC-type Fe3+/spermidine/putrescine transport system ATPase subunit
MSHVFISYTRVDQALVKRLIDGLTSGGLKVWIDSIGLHPGTFDWEKALRAAIHDASAILLIASPNTWHSTNVRDELSIALMENKPIYPIWIDGTHYIDCVPLGYGYTQFIDVRGDQFETGLEAVIRTLTTPDPIIPPAELVIQSTSPTDVLTASTKPESVEPRNPYKGLLPFKIDDRQDFFGREALIRDMLGLLHQHIGTARFLAVVGPSGSGKSSAVLAGLLPVLQDDAIKGSGNWLYLDPIVPGERPVENLAAALFPHLPAKAHATIRVDLEEPNGRGLHLLSKQATGGERLCLLYVDQFEEVFTLTEDERERRQFINLLTTAAKEANGTLIVIVSMRADFFDRPMLYPELGALFEKQTKTVLPMTLAELYEAVKMPALLSDVQLGFEDGLIAEIVFSVRDQPAALPLLQFALDQLFKKREGRRITQQAYDDIGGVLGALTRHADQNYEQLPSDDHKRMARTLFLRLIDLGDLDQEISRRRVSVDELTLADKKYTQVLSDVLDTFLKARLLVASQTGDQRTIELCHEALIEHWARLRSWVSEARDDLRMQSAIHNDAADWLRRGKPADVLYRGTVLVDAQNWVERNLPNRNEMEFITASVSEEARRIAEQKKIARRVQNLERASVVFGLMVALAILAAALAFVGLNSAREAQFVSQTQEADISARSTQFANNQSRFATLAVGGIILSPDQMGSSDADIATMTAMEQANAWIPIVDTFDGVEMVQVPAGCFYMGNVTNVFTSPVTKVCFDELFWIDRFEVTNALFARFGGNGSDIDRYTDPQMPRHTVTWFEAREFCEDKRPGDARLPTEAEWEYAARGPDSRPYPWGSRLSPEYAAYGRDGDPIGAADVGSFELGVSWVGAHDMAGNIWEWVNSALIPYPYDATDGREDPDLEGMDRVLRGGAWWDTGEFLPSFVRGNVLPDISDIGFGFRCMMPTT